MKISFLFIAFFLILNAGSAPKALAQFNVSGTVSSVYDNKTELQPGANILEKGTSSGTATDINGKFSYTCTTENPTLVFSFVGQKTKEIIISSDTVLHLVLEEDDVEIDDHYYYQVYEIGLSSGVVYNPLGVNLRRIFPRIRTSAEINWRFLTKNNYLYLKITSSTLYNRRLNFQARYRNLFFHKNDDRIEQIVGLGQFSALKTNFSLGYAHNFRKIANENRQNSGLALGFNRWFGYFWLNTEAIIWSDEIQYRIDLQTSLPTNRRVEVGISHEQIFGYREWGVSMSYRFDTRWGSY